MRRSCCNTAANRVWPKYTKLATLPFLPPTNVNVSIGAFHSVHRGVYPGVGGASRGCNHMVCIRGVYSGRASRGCIQGVYIHLGYRCMHLTVSMHPHQKYAPPPPPARGINRRVVRILLECIFVGVPFFFPQSNSFPKL